MKRRDEALPVGHKLFAAVLSTVAIQCTARAHSSFSLCQNLELSGASSRHFWHVRTPYTCAAAP